MAGSSSSVEHHENASQLQHRYRDYGGNPLAHILSETSSARLPAFGAALEPGLYKPSPFKFANPVPLGLSGFALTTFLLSCVNLGVLGLDNPALVLAPALAYGGFVQLLAGMWDIALGNGRQAVRSTGYHGTLMSGGAVFGGTALSSYGAFWISLGIILTPGGFGIQDSYSGTDFYTAFGLYIFGWFIFTFLLWLCTLKSTLFFSALFATVWISFLCLGSAYLDAQNNGTGMPNVPLTRAGGGFGVVAGFIAWYIMFAGIADASNSFFVVPVFHFPWSEKGREAKKASVVMESGDTV